MRRLTGLFFAISIGIAPLSFPITADAVADESDKQCRKPVKTATYEEEYHKSKPPYPALRFEERNGKQVAIRNLYKMKCEDTTNKTVVVTGECETELVCTGKKCKTTGGEFVDCKKTDVKVQPGGTQTPPPTTPPPPTNPPQMPQLPGGGDSPGGAPSQKPPTEEKPPANTGCTAGSLCNPVLWGDLPRDPPPATRPPSDSVAGRFDRYLEDLIREDPPDSDSPPNSNWMPHTDFGPVRELPVLNPDIWDQFDADAIAPQDRTTNNTFQDQRVLSPEDYVPDPDTALNQPEEQPATEKLADADTKTEEKPCSGYIDCLGKWTSDTWKSITDKGLDLLNPIGSAEAKPSGEVRIGPDNKINPVDFYNMARDKFANSSLNGTAPEWAQKFGVDGTPESWARFATQLCQQESGCRVVTANSDGSLPRFATTNPGEKSFGPLQFNRGEYGLKTWQDVNDPGRTVDALIRVAEMNKATAYFGSVQRSGEILQHNSWFDNTVAPYVNQNVLGGAPSPTFSNPVIGNFDAPNPGAAVYTPAYDFLANTQGTFSAYDRGPAFAYSSPLDGDVWEGSSPYTDSRFANNQPDYSGVPDIAVDVTPGDLGTLGQEPVLTANGQQSLSQNTLPFVNGDWADVPWVPDYDDFALSDVGTSPINSLPLADTDWADVPWVPDYGDIALGDTSAQDVAQEPLDFGLDQDAYTEQAQQDLIKEWQARTFADRLARAEEEETAYATRVFNERDTGADAQEIANQWRGSEFDFSQEARDVVMAERNRIDAEAQSTQDGPLARSLSSLGNEQPIDFDAFEGGPDTDPLWKWPTDDESTSAETDSRPRTSGETQREPIDPEDFSAVAEPDAKAKSSTEQPKETTCLSDSCVGGRIGDDRSQVPTKEQEDLKKKIDEAVARQGALKDRLEDLENLGDKNSLANKAQKGLESLAKNSQPTDADKTAMRVGKEALNELKYDAQTLGKGDLARKLQDLENRLNRLGQDSDRVAAHVKKDFEDSYMKAYLAGDKQLMSLIASRDAVVSVGNNLMGEVNRTSFDASALTRNLNTQIASLDTQIGNEYRAYYATFAEVNRTTDISQQSVQPFQTQLAVAELPRATPDWAQVTQSAQEYAHLGYDWTPYVPPAVVAPPDVSSTALAAPVQEPFAPQEPGGYDWTKDIATGNEYESPPSLARLARQGYAAAPPPDELGERYSEGEPLNPPASAPPADNPSISSAPPAVKEYLSHGKNSETLLNALATAPEARTSEQKAVAAAFSQWTAGRDLVTAGEQKLAEDNARLATLRDDLDNARTRTQEAAIRQQISTLEIASQTTANDVASGKIMQEKSEKIIAELSVGGERSVETQRLVDKIQNPGITQSISDYLKQTAASQMEKGSVVTGLIVGLGSVTFDSGLGLVSQIPGLEDYATIERQVAGLTQPTSWNVAQTANDVLNVATIVPNKPTNAVFGSLLDTISVARVGTTFADDVALGASSVFRTPADHIVHGTTLADNTLPPSSVLTHADDLAGVRAPTPDTPSAGTPGPRATVPEPDVPAPTRVDVPDPPQTSVPSVGTREVPAGESAALRNADETLERALEAERQAALAQNRVAVNERPVGSEPTPSANTPGPRATPDPEVPAPVSKSPDPTDAVRQEYLKDPVVRTNEYRDFARLDVPPARAVVQDASIAKYLLNRDEMMNSYTTQNGNKIASADEAKKLFTDVGYNGTNADAVHEASSALSKDVWRRNLAVNPEPGAIIYTGGPGAGKSSAISLLPDMEVRAAAIMDGSFSSNSVNTRAGEALAAGKNVDVVYVYRDPLDAWENGVISRMLTNPDEGGRSVSLNAFIKGHEDSWRTVNGLLQNPRDGVSVTLIDNSLGRGNAAQLSVEKFYNIPAGPSGEFYTQGMRDVLVKRTNDLLERGVITEAQYRQLIPDTALAERPLVSSPDNLLARSPVVDSPAGPWGVPAPLPDGVRPVPHPSTPQSLAGGAWDDYIHGPSPVSRQSVWDDYARGQNVSPVNESPLARQLDDVVRDTNAQPQTSVPSVGTREVPPGGRPASDIGPGTTVEIPPPAEKTPTLWERTKSLFGFGDEVPPAPREAPRVPENSVVRVDPDGNARIVPAETTAPPARPASPTLADIADNPSPWRLGSPLDEPAQPVVRVPAGTTPDATTPAPATTRGVNVEPTSVPTPSTPRTVSRGAWDEYIESLGPVPRQQSAWDDYIRSLNKSPVDESRFVRQLDDAVRDINAGKNPTASAVTPRNSLDDVIVRPSTDTPAPRPTSPTLADVAENPSPWRLGSPLDEPAKPVVRVPAETRVVTTADDAVPTVPPRNTVPAPDSIPPATTRGVTAEPTPPMRPSPIDDLTGPWGRPVPQVDDVVTGAQPRTSVPSVGNRTPGPWGRELEPANVRGPWSPPTSGVPLIPLTPASQFQPWSKLVSGGVIGLGLGSLGLQDGIAPAFIPGTPSPAPTNPDSVYSVVGGPFPPPDPNQTRFAACGEDPNSESCKQAIASITPPKPSQPPPTPPPGQVPPPHTPQTPWTPQTTGCYASLEPIIWLPQCQRQSGQGGGLAGAMSALGQLLGKMLDKNNSNQPTQGTGVPTPTPATTTPSTRQPSVGITANPMSVRVGSTTRLSWAGVNTDSCSLSMNSANIFNDLPSRGSRTSPVLATTTAFSISCTGVGTSTRADITVIAR
jgi:hypothetical protein